MLGLVLKDILNSIDHSPADLNISWPPADRAPALKGAGGDSPIFGQLLLVHVAEHGVFVLHGAVLLRSVQAP